MSCQVNTEYVNDIAKLMMHRLIARELCRDPSLVAKARVCLDRSSDRFRNHTFISEWSDVLDLPPLTIRRLLTSRDERMVRLRLSSPFVLTDGVDLEDADLRRRIWKAAKRVAQRSATVEVADRARMVA